MGRLNRSAPPGLWTCGQRKIVAHMVQKAHHSNRSGQLMCYLNRTS